MQSLIGCCCLVPCLPLLRAARLLFISLYSSDLPPIPCKSYILLIHGLTPLLLTVLSAISSTFPRLHHYHLLLCPASYPPLAFSTSRNPAFNGKPSHTVLHTLPHFTPLPILPRLTPTHSVPQHSLLSLLPHPLRHPRTVISTHIAMQTLPSRGVRKVNQERFKCWRVKFPLSLTCFHCTCLYLCFSFLFSLPLSPLSSIPSLSALVRKTK